LSDNVDLRPFDVHTFGVATSELLGNIAILSRKLYLANPVLF